MRRLPSSPRQPEWRRGRRPAIVRRTVAAVALVAGVMGVALGSGGPALAAPGQDDAPAPEVGTVEVIEVSGSFGHFGTGSETGLES